MAVLSFRKFTEGRTEAPRDWSQNEIGEFLRAHSLLSRNGVSIGIDRGVSDIGEPWLVFFDTQSHDVFLHVARIKGRCVMVSEPLELRLWAADVTELMSRFEESVRGLIKERDEHNNKVVLHPAARMIMAISAVFLLFKLDNNSNVYARDDLHVGADGTARKFEPSVMMRVQSAMARLIEAAETPAAMAAVAGVLLASEIIKHNNAESIGAEAQAALVAAPTHDDVHVAPSTEVVDTLVQDIDEAVPVATPLAPVHVALASVLVEVTVDLVQDVVASFRAPPQQIAVAETPAPVVAAPAKAEAAVAGGAEPTHVTPLPVSLSAAVVQNMFNIDWTSGSGIKLMSAGQVIQAPAFENDMTIDLGAIPALVPGGNADWHAAPPALVDHAPAHSLDALTMDMLPGLVHDVGYYTQTSVSGAPLAEMLAHFINVFQSLEIEYAGGDVMLEQTNLGNDLHDIGIWRNVMSDGSIITVVGQAGLVDDVPYFI